MRERYRPDSRIRRLVRVVQGFFVSHADPRNVRGIPSAQRDEPVLSVRMTSILHYPIGPEMAHPACMRAKTIPVREPAASIAAGTACGSVGGPGRRGKRCARFGPARLTALQQRATHRCAHGHPLAAACTARAVEPARFHLFRFAFALRVGKRARFGTEPSGPAREPAVHGRTPAVESTAEGSSSFCDWRSA